MDEGAYPFEWRLLGVFEDLADNADHSPEYLARVRSSASGYMSVPFSDDVELSMRLGGVVPTDADSGK